VIYETQKYFQFGDFYDPFIKTLKPLRLGNRLKVVDSWDGIKKSFKPNDIWIEIRSLFKDPEDGGFIFNVVRGWYDSCGNSVFDTSHFGHWTGHGVYGGQNMGYQIGTDVVEWILGRDGFRQ
jgi:hypothetical protein